MSNAKKATVESLTAYYKQHYYEGEYSSGDLCVMLARAEAGIEAMAETLAMAEMGCVECGADLRYVWEAEVHDGSEVSTTREVCDHLKSVATVEDDGAMCWYVFGYCPHCGERLDPTEQDLYRVANWSGTTDTGIPYVEKLTPTGTTLSNENGNL